MYPVSVRKRVVGLYLSSNLRMRQISRLLGINIATLKRIRRLHTVGGARAGILLIVFTVWQNNHRKAKAELWEET